MPNRKAAEDHILTYIDKIAQGGDNLKIYQDYFKSMSDKQFDEFMKRLESEEEYLVITVPHGNRVKVNTENNLKIAKELGHNFFQKLWIEGKDGVPTYLTPIPYLVVDLPLRRLSQLLIKKINVPDDNKVIDALTNQPTGDSKGAAFTYPELQVCTAMGLQESLVELLKYRGGDARGYAAYNGMLSKYGRASLKALSQFASGVESTRTLKTFLTCLHLKNTL